MFKEKEIIETTGIFKLIADPTRFKIILLLYNTPEGMCVHELADAVDVSHSATSHQLAKLEARGIVHSYRHGKKVCYALSNNELTKKIRNIIKGYT